MEVLAEKKPIEEQVDCNIDIKYLLLTGLITTLIRGSDCSGPLISNNYPVIRIFI